VEAWRVAAAPTRNDPAVTERTKTLRENAVLAAADRLHRAGASGVTCEPVADLIGPSDIGLAYQVQQVLTERRLAAGARLVGRKIGLTSAAVQRQIGVDRPDFGVLFADMHYDDGQTIPFQRLLQPKAEGEIAFRLRRDVDDPALVTGPAAIRSAIGSAHPAAEIVDSRIDSWRIGITDTVADNASSGVYVLGGSSTPLHAFSPVDARMTMRRNGSVVSEGTGRDCLGDPVEALLWLARTALDIGSPLRAGDLVLSGALGPMVDVGPGDVVEVAIEPLGTVTARFSAAAG
jgi:2-keto-4-pentenoate hydratase